jgi:biotin carboxyl carrier protein
VDGQAFAFQRPTPAAGRRVERHHLPVDDALRAEMPGQVRDVLAAEGQQVSKGQTLLLLEAMKMEMRVAAPFAGRVERLPVAEGQVVERGQVLAEISREQEA